MHQAAIGRAPFAYTDTLGNNIARGFIGRVDHFRAGILVLTVTRQSDADHPRRGICALSTPRPDISSSALIRYYSRSI